jgi:hypothetical protein
VALAAPGSSLEAGFDEYVRFPSMGSLAHTDLCLGCYSDQNAEAFNQIMYKTARDELAKICREHEVV